MLKPYKYKHSEIHKVQSFVNHVILDIISRAPKISDKVFSSNLVLPKYRKLIDEVNAEYILNPLSEAYLICKSLKSENLKVLKKAVHNNNKIRQLCNGELEPVQYSEISKINTDLSKHLKIFCDFIYDQSINKAPFYNKYEKIGDYYKKLVGRSSICRFCGINKVLTEFHSKRSALDHYLPRQYYPFNSVNFRNLIPICDICNSKYKLGENTLFETLNKGMKNETQKRVKAFYPFRRDIPDIKISIKFNKAYTSMVEPKDIEIELSCIGFQEQVESWERMFGIKENYKAECCTEEMYSYYEEQYMAEVNYDKTHIQYIDMLSKNKFGDMNFLKIPFLEALQ